MSSARLCRSAPYVALLVLFLVVPALLVGPAAAAGHRKPVKGMGRVLGVMPDKKKSSRRLVRPHALPALGTTFLRSLHRRGPKGPHAPLANMTYHGGPLVIGPHTTHIVYWEPAGFTVTANYHSLIERYVGDVAADSGRATNVYATDTQYDDSTNTFIQYQQTYAGAMTDTNAFPATVAGCPLTDGTRTVSNCLTATQEATELDNFIQANSLPRGLDHMYFLILPDNVETCFDDFSDCGNILNTSPRYCAYHSSFNIGGHGLTLWANEPYIGFADNHCNSGTASARPNGDVTDHELNVLSHEHNEIITDPTGGGWFDTNGAGENGDLCNFNFGTRIGNNGVGDFNQLINHNPYELQLEWSNAISGCAANYGAVPPTADFTFTPASPHALDPVSFDGGTLSHSNNAGGYLIDYQWNFGDSGTGSGPTPSHTYAAAGTYNVTLTVEDDAGLTASVVHQVVVVQRPTVTTYTGPTSEDYHDSVALSGTLTDAATSAGVPGELLTFTVGAQSCSAFTDGSGSASCSLVLNQVPGAYTVTASFTGDSVYGASSDSEPFTITREETTLTYTGPTVILANASSLTASATLLEDGAVPPNPAGQTVTFTLGAQSCSGTTDSSGNVSCTISPVSSQLGNQTITSVFAGDAYYLPSSDSDQVVVFAFPSRGAFTLGDLTVAGAGSNTVTWWSHSWSSLNSLSGGQAPSSFKGFASGVTLPQMSPPELCGTTFTAQPGNSGHPPDTVPEYMGVLVTSAVTPSGSTLNGTWGGIVVVHTDPGYGPNPGHPGTGTIVATFC